MPVNLLSELQQWHSGDADGGGRFRLHIRRLERSLLRNWNLLGDHERGAVGDGDIQHYAGAVCFDRDGSWNGNRNGDEQSGGN